MELVELTDPPTSGTAMPVQGARQVQSAPATRPTAGSRAIPQSWLSDGVRPLLFAVDGIALTVGALTVGRMTVFAALFAITVLVLFHIAGLHRSRLDLSVLDDVPRLLGNGLAAFALNVAGAALFGWGGVASALLDSSLVTFLAVTLGLVLLGRLASYAFVRGLRRRGLVSHRTLILGAGQVGAQVGSTLVDHPEYGLEPVGFLDSDPHPAVVSLPVIGGHHELAQVLCATTSGQPLSPSPRCLARRWSMSSVPATGCAARSSSCRACSRSRTSATTWTTSGAFRWCDCAGRASGPGPGS
jgi:hypothetical protein